MVEVQDALPVTTESAHRLESRSSYLDAGSFVDEERTRHRLDTVELVKQLDRIGVLPQNTTTNPRLSDEDYIELVATKMATSLRANAKSDSGHVYSLIKTDQFTASLIYEPEIDTDAPTNSMFENTDSPKPATVLVSKPIKNRFRPAPTPLRLVVMPNIDTPGAQAAADAYFAKFVEQKTSSLFSKPSASPGEGNGASEASAA